MSEIFTASNGILLDKYGRLASASDTSRAEIHPARKEFYEQLRDKELGRWRDPVVPDYVVYPDRESDEVFIVINEYLGTSTEVRLYGGCLATGTRKGAVRGVVERFLEAHKSHAPWHAAQPGELWKITTDDGQVFTGLAIKGVGESKIAFVSPDGWAWSLDQIRGGVRVWAGEEK